jgi:hypothetical protein
MLVFVNHHFWQTTFSCQVDARGKKMTIFKLCLMKIFIETPGFLEIVLQKKLFSTLGIVHVDDRGGHKPS